MVRSAYRLLGTGTIVALAIGLLAVQLGHTYRAMSTGTASRTYLALEAGLPIGIALALVALAMWVHRQEWDAREVQLVAYWASLAVVGMAAVTGFEYWSQRLLREAVHPFAVAVSAIGAMALIGGIAGVERVRQKRQRRELRRNEQRYRSLTEDVLDSSAVGTFILDDQFEVVWANEATEEYFGLDRERIVGADKREFVGELAEQFEEPDRFRERVLATYEDNTFTEHFECHVPENGDRPEQWLEHWSQPIETGLYAGGRIEHYTDITEQKRTEQRLTHRESQLRDVGEVISAEDLGVTEKRDRLLGICRDALETTYAGFVRVEDDRATIEITHAPSGDVEPGTALPLSDAYVDRVLAADQPVQRLTVDAGMAGRLSPDPEAPRVGSYVVAPVTADGTYHGALCLFDTVEREQLFEEWQLALLNVIADWLGSALSRVERAQQRRQELREEREKISALVEDVENYAIFTLDPDGRVTSWNRGAEQITDYARSQVLNEHLRLFFPEASVPEQLLDRAAETGRSQYEGWQLRADGSRYWADTTITALTADGDGVDEDRGVTSDASDASDASVDTHVDAASDDIAGDVVGYVVIVRDMTERRTRERRLNAVFNQTVGLTGLLEPDGTLLEANESLLAFGGFDREAVVGHALWDLDWWLSEADRQRVREAVQTAATGEFVRDEIELQGTEGVATVDFSINPVTDETDAVVLLVIEGRDITERKRRERRLSVLHRVLRHNLRNEMTAISGYAEHLRTSLTDPELAEYADRIYDTARDVGRLSDRVTDIEETIEGSSEQPARPIGELVAEVVDTAAEAYPDATITAAYDDNEHVSVPPRLQTTLEHVVENAIEHNSDPDPTVRVRVADERTAGRRWLRVAVADDGPGIPDQERQPLEEDEVTDLKHGSGLGLWVAKWTVESIGGQFGFEDSDMGGTTVVFRFPKRELD